jgi:ankyrin repeat protein
MNKYGDTIEWSCLNYAIVLNKPKIVEYLLNEGSNPYLKDKLKENSLDLAKFLENEEIIKLINTHDPIKLNFKKKIEYYDINFYYVYKTLI